MRSRGGQRRRTKGGTARLGEGGGLEGPVSGGARSHHWRMIVETERRSWKGLGGGFVGVSALFRRSKLD